VVQRPCFEILCPLCDKQIYDITENSMYDRLKMHAWGAHRLRPSEFDNEVMIGGRWVKTRRISVRMEAKSMSQIAREEVGIQLGRAHARDFGTDSESKI
jgi:hypothetical protein